MEGEERRALQWRARILLWCTLGALCDLDPLIYRIIIDIGDLFDQEFSSIKNRELAPCSRKLDF